MKKTLRLKPSFNEEKKLWERGYQFVAGIDEVGRGAFAGPLVAASVMLPKDFQAKDINDSKLLSPKKRELLCEYIKCHAISYTISEIEVSYINQYGVGKANQKALYECLAKSKKKLDFALVDGFRIKNIEDNKQEAIIHGDMLSISIAAASIIAKVYRDRLMVKLHLKFPYYNFLRNKGYGTKEHQLALKKYGLSKVHRTSFSLGKFLS